MSTKVYSGSCHCGDVTYQLRLALPPRTDIGLRGARLYKCNCSTCLKMGMLVCRPEDPKNDFIVTSPASIEDVGCYRCLSEKVGWYFCKRCGVRTFCMGGDWVSEDVNVSKWAGKDDGDEKLQKVLKSIPHDGTMGYDGKPLHYVSVNGITLDGIDLIEAYDKGWIMYVENRDRKDGELPQLRYNKPFSGGCY